MGGAKTFYDLPELPKIGPYAVDFLFTSLGGTGIEGAEVTMFTRLCCTNLASKAYSAI